MDSGTLLDNVLDALGECIMDQDYETLFLILDELELDERQLIAMYYFCVDLVTNSGDNVGISLLSDYFAKRSEYGSVIQVLLFSRYQDQERVLGFFYSANGLKLNEYLRLWMQLADESDMRAALQTLLAIREGDSQLQVTLFEEALRRAEAEEVPLIWLVRELLAEQITLRRPLSEKPHYIIECELRTQSEMLEQFIIPEAKEYPNKRQQLREACQFYAEKAYKNGEITRPEILMEALNIEQKVSETKEDFDAFLENYEKEQRQIALQKDTELFRILGPCHPVDGRWELDMEGGYICQRNGGCRMMTCIENEDEDDELGLRFEQPHLFDWFTGSCDVCLRPIEKKHYAVRALAEQGGFIGCFCSPEHALSSLCSESVSHAITRKALNELQCTGLYDRKEEEVEEMTEHTLGLVSDFLEFLRVDKEDFDF